MKRLLGHVETLTLATLLLISAALTILDIFA